MKAALLRSSGYWMPQSVTSETQKDLLITNQYYVYKNITGNIGIIPVIFLQR